MTESNKSSSSPMMVRLVVVGVIFIIGIVAGFALQTYLVSGTGEASVEISAPTLDLDVTPTPDNSDLQLTIEALEVALDDAEQQSDDTMSTAVAMQTSVLDDAQATIDTIQAELIALAEATEEPVEVIEAEETEAPDEDSESEATEEPEEVVEADDEDEPSEDAATEGDRILYRIVQEESEVRFSMGTPSAELANLDDGVVGTTSDVAADIIVDLGNPANSQLGLVRINARTMTTGRSFLDPIIRSDVLLSAQDEYEFLEFQPTNLIGLPDTIAIGDTIEFQIEGDLTILDATNSVVFDVTVTLVDETRLEGSAIGSIFHADFNMVIPAAPSFVNAPPVADEVFLEIEFVALVVED